MCSGFFLVGNVPVHLAVPLQQYITRLVADSTALGVVPEYVVAEPGLCKADVNYGFEVDALGSGVVAEPGFFKADEHYGDENDVFGGGVAEPGMCKADVQLGAEDDAFCVGGGVVAAPVHFGEEVDANSGGEGVVAEEHYGGVVAVPVAATRDAENIEDDSV